MIAAAVLAPLGIALLVLGVSVLRNAEKVVTDARRQLEGMFGESRPELFTGHPDPLAARIGGAAIAVAGAGMLVAAVVVLLVS